MQGCKLQNSLGYRARFYTEEPKQKSQNKNLNLAREERRNIKGVGRKGEGKEEEKVGGKERRKGVKEGKEDTKIETSVSQI